MTVSVSNTNINNSFDTWRLNTNFAATVLSNNVVTVARAGSANRGGVAKGNGHVAGTFTANEMRTTALKAGNTSNDGAWLYVRSNTSVNATSLTVTANTTFQGNVDFVTSGTDRLVLGDISRVRVTGGSQGQFLRIDGGSDTPNFKSLTLRDITDLSTNSAPIILSASNTTFSDNGDSPAVIFAANNGTDKVSLFLASNTSDATSSDLTIQLSDTGGESRVNITDSGNTIVAYIDSDGNIVTTSNLLPNADDASDIGAVGAEFKDGYFDGTLNTDVLAVATGASQGVSASLIPVTDAAGNLGSTTRKWGTVWADNTNGGAGVFNTLGVSSSLTVNGAVTFNGDVSLSSDNLTLDGNTVIGDASTDTVTFNAQVDSDFDPQTGSQRDMGSTSNRWHNIYANNIIANNVTTDNDVTINGNLTVQGSTTIASGQILTVDDGVFSTLGVTGTLTANGDVDLGNATTDSITVTGQFDSSLIPISDDQYDLGTATKQWQDIWIDGTASIDTLTVDELATFSGDRITVSGNGFFSDSIDVADSIDVTNSITNDGTVMLGKNGKLHANNTITNGTLTTGMLANTMAIATFQTHGSASQIPVISVNGKGQVIGISNTTVAGVTGLTYTQSNNNIRITTATGVTYDDTIDAAGTGTAVKGVASFQAGDFSLSSGHVSLADTANGAVLAINGTSNEVNVSRLNGTVTVGLPDDVTVTGQLNVGENVVVSGNLIVQGTTTTVNSETVNIADNIIVLNSNETGTPSQNGGISIERGTSTNYSFVWNETDDRWTLGDRNLVANTFIGNVTGNLDGTAELANTAVKLQSAHNIGVRLAGDITGYANVDFQGTGDVLINMTNTTYNNDVVLGTDTSGNYVASLVAGALIDLQNNTGEGATPTIDVDLSELTDMTQTIVGTDEFVVLDSSAQRRKAANEIPLSIFNNDAGFGVGDITAVTAGTGLDGGGTSGAVTLNIESDLRGDVTQIGQDTNDYYSITTTQHRWFLDGAEDMRLTNDGTLDVEGDVIAHSATVSDERLKENIEKVTDAVSKVQQLNGYTFNYKKDGREGAGVIAQEVQSVLPSAVKEHAVLNADGDYLIVEYDQLTALLIESIKELKAEIDELKANK